MIEEQTLLRESANTSLHSLEQDGENSYDSYSNYALISIMNATSADTLSRDHCYFPLQVFHSELRTRKQLGIVKSHLNQTTAVLFNKCMEDILCVASVPPRHFVLHVCVTILDTDFVHLGF